MTQPNVLPLMAASPRLRDCPCVARRAAMLYTIGMFIIVMGVSGCGKSTIGSRLAATLAWTFLDADDFHSSENIAKMRQGIALTAADRRPWIDALIARLNQQPDVRAVLACSALTREIRARFRAETHSRVLFVYLEADYAQLQARLLARRQHVAKADLLQSQWDTLEEPNNALVIDADQTPEAICERIVRQLQV